MGGGGSCFQEEKPESVCVCVFNFWLHPLACGTLVPPPKIKSTPLVLEDRVLTTGSPGLSPSMYLFYTQKSELRISSSAWNLQNVPQLSLMPRKGCGRVCPVARVRCCGPYKTHPHV